MTMRPAIVMLMLAALSAAAAFYVTRHSTDISERVRLQQRLPTVDSISVDRVTVITLRRHGEPELQFSRDGGGSAGWVQTAPIRHPVDQFSISQLIELAKALTVLQQIDEDDLRNGLSPAALGFDPPKCILKYESPAGSHTLEFGRRGIGGRGYIRIAGRLEIYAVPQDLHERAIAHDPREWRDRTLFPGLDPDIHRIEMLSSDRSISLSRGSRSGHEPVPLTPHPDGRGSGGHQGRWMLDSPVKTRAEVEAVEQLLSAMTRARHSGFVMDNPEDLSRFGLSPPAGSFSFSFSIDDSTPEAPPVRLLIGSRIGLNSEDRFGMVEGRDTVVRLSAPVLAALFPQLDKLIAATASGMNPADVKTLFISGPEHEFRLQRDLERWVAPDQENAPVPARQVEELLNLLTTVRAPQVIIKEFPLDEQIGFVTFHGFDARPKDSVRIARDAQTGQWLLENGDGVIRVFPGSVKLPLSPQDFGLSP